MVIGGVVAGLTLLIKETAAPLVILPLAYLGTVPRAEWRRLAARYLVGFVITVGWWFVTVYLLAGEIFPLEGFRNASDSALQRSWSFNAWAQLLIAAFVASWLVVAIGRRRDPLARVLVLAGLAFVPAAYVAWEAGYGLRQFVPIALLSCMAFGVAAADVLAAATRRAPRGIPGWRVALVVIVAVMAVPVGLTQSHTRIEAVEGDDLDVELGQFRRGLHGDPSALTTPKFNVQLWAHASSGADSIAGSGFDDGAAARPSLDDALWINTNAHGFTSMPRRNLARRFRDADYLVLSGPHTYGPRSLATWLPTARTWGSSPSHASAARKEMRGRTCSGWTTRTSDRDPHHRHVGCGRAPRRRWRLPPDRPDRDHGDPGLAPALRRRSSARWPRAVRAPGRTAARTARRRHPRWSLPSHGERESAKRRVSRIGARKPLPAIAWSREGDSNS